NFHCVLEEYHSEMPGRDWDGEVQIIAVSANSPDELKRKWDSWSPNDSWDAIAEKAAESRAAFSMNAEFRLIVVAQKDSDFATLIQAASDSYSGKKVPAGVFFGRGPAPGKLAVLFPGQGSQYVGMLRDLACQFPEMQSALAVSPDLCLNDKIYPSSSVAAKATLEQTLRATD